MSDHLANGRVVAQVRRWLEILDNPTEDYGYIKILSHLHSCSGDKRELTVHQVRTLLAEHDAYRSEVIGKRVEPRVGAEARVGRDRAVEHAINALTPIIPAFRGDAIGRAIIELAEELRAYIEEPTP